MGDRNNPILFGPEWMRNLPNERSTVRSAPNVQNMSSNPSTATSAGSAGASGGSAPSFFGASTSNSTVTSKILLAKLRYGREEMLALCDKNAEAPMELKNIDTLYQPRGKQPVALNNTFEDDMRDNLRGPPPPGGLSSSDRFGSGRGVGRGVINDCRGRTRGSYTRSQITGRGAHYVSKVGGSRAPYTGIADDDTGPIRPWNNTLNASNRNSGDQTDWSPKTYRMKRPGTSTNWRQPQSREEAEEWRSSEPGRSRQVERWGNPKEFAERDWGERSMGEKQSWSSNRRAWVGGDSQNEENLPEWAGENAECGGTFDSSGAFHGYSNDDTNLPKHQEAAYSLTRSHTHGSFPRPKAVEEGSDEWWASEKAKKLSPKRFDASDIKFKKQPGIGIADLPNSLSTNNKSNTSKEETQQETQEKREPSTAPEPPESNAAASQSDDKFSNQNLLKSKYVVSKRFDAMMRSDINAEEASDERGDFQCVIITPNNSLRQKHQHMVMAAEGQKLMQMKGKNQSEIDHRTHKSPEDMLVVNILGMTMDDDDMLSSSLSSCDLTNTANVIPPRYSVTSLESLSSMSNSSSMQAGIPMPAMQPGGMQKVSGLQMPSGGLQGSGPSSSSMQPGLPNPGMPSVGLQNPGLPSGGMQNPNLQSSMQNPNLQSSMQTPRVQTPGMQPVMQSVGISNSALNASLGLPIGPGNIMPLQGVPQAGMPNVCMANNIGASGMGVMGTPAMQSAGNMNAFQPGSGLPGMSSNNVGNNSLFLGQNSNNPSMSSSNDMPMSNNHNNQNNMFPLHGLQHSGPQNSFTSSIYSSNSRTLADEWYYEDPERNIQGPFSSKDMYNWYRAGFFSPSLMVKRACETIMRPLGSYGPVVPFAQMDMMPGFPMTGGFDSRHAQANHESMLRTQPSLGLDVMNFGNINLSDNSSMDNLQFGSVGLMANQSFGQPQQMVDSLWGQPLRPPSTNADIMWMQQPRSEAHVNNFPMFFWDRQPSAIAANSLLPEDITKEMKTEDQILAQLRASQSIGQSGLQFLGDPQPPAPPTAKPDDLFPPIQSAIPNLEELHKLIQKDSLSGNNNVANQLEDDTQQKAEKARLEQSSSESNINKQKTATELKPAAKSTKDTEKSTKNKENNNTKNKTKKVKEDKKEESVEIKSKEEEVIKAEKRSEEPSPSKNKKEEKANKKELEREKKEWLKEGFTIVKGPEKSVAKDNKKKVEEARVAEEADRKRKEEEKLLAEEEKKKKQAETTRKQQLQQQEQQAAQQQRQATESVAKKAPWSAVATQAMQATTRDGLTLAEIQRLEREKKLEQMKEQQQMMQIIAQQQAAALAREQEMQAGLGWAKKKGNNTSTPGQSLAEIQAEARKQAQAATAQAAQAAQALEEAQALVAGQAPPANHVPWGTTHNGGAALGGFWDTQLEQPTKQTKQETPKQVESKIKKKPTVVIPPSKKETSPALEFDNWCTGVLANWSSKIDVPTFVGFLKDIESPYEVKDYVKYYLGESKDSNDFARHFLERRSKLLRVGMVTPSDDLCSPAIAVNPRTISGSDYQEVKGKGKKTKKNKMLKVDARILGFSVTASEDRINVGDIDTV